MIGVPHTGSYMQIGKAFETLFGALHARGLAKPEMRMIGVYFDDPDIVPAEKLRSIACATGGSRATVRTADDRWRRICRSAP
ncbi:DNA gyrase inhibitor GyrI [Rhizobium mongolense]|uniref:DNA gyrase inhibitor GyrI n=1 Tax=Rhizobium mongolense TaxID=57676 RepID=A0ABR6IL73_9HYPH|nr:DNA gyrase inhibitor GyrI [Rhizobium mongolense]